MTFYILQAADRLQVTGYRLQATGYRLNGEVRTIRAAAPLPVDSLHNKVQYSPILTPG